MADFNSAVTYLLTNEGGLYENPETGEVANFGITFRWLKTIDPEATADTVRNLTRAAAVALYEKYWWDQLKIPLIASNNVATKLLDMCVNTGPITGVKILQAAINEPREAGDQLTVDGFVGPIVAIAVADECAMPNGEYGLLSAIVGLLEDHYRKVAEDNPVLADQLPGWLKRAEKLPTV